MEYQVPEPSDIEDVRALNLAFLNLLRRNPGLAMLAQFPASLRQQITSLSATQLNELAACPFLLFSYDESDLPRWQRLFAGQHNPDLFEACDIRSDELRTLSGSGLSFLWQLARRNRFAARLVCGASAGWCDQLTSQSYCRIMAIGQRHPDLLTLRMAGRTDVWHRLLSLGINAKAEVREAVRISCLQIILTQPVAAAHDAWREAASRIRRPALAVADRPRRGGSRH